MLVQPQQNIRKHNHPGHNSNRGGGFSGSSHHQKAVQPGGGNQEQPSKSAPSVRRNPSPEDLSVNTFSSDTDNAIHNGRNTEVTLEINNHLRENQQYVTKGQKNRLKRQHISIVFNKSSTILSKEMEDLLNRGFNFSILPNKLDITQVLVDFTYFERTMIWKEFWHGKEDAGNLSIPIFKRRKTNLPRNHKSPNQLKTFF